MDTLTVNGTLESLSPIADYVLSAAAEAGLDRKATFRLRLAVDEIATNIITHGYSESGSSGNLDIQAIISPETLTINLDDFSEPYDPRQRNDPDVTLPPEQRGIGGLGTFLALRGVDAFSYERVGNRNRTIFVVNRPAAVPAPVAGASGAAAATGASARPAEAPSQE